MPAADRLTPIGNGTPAKTPKDVLGAPPVTKGKTYEPGDEFYAPQPKYIVI